MDFRYIYGAVSERAIPEVHLGISPWGLVLYSKSCLKDGGVTVSTCSVKLRLRAEVR